MDPAFMLPQQPAPVFGRTTNFEYKKILSDPIWNANSPPGRHTFRWQNQAGEWWVPSQSYLRIRLAFMVCDGPNKFRPVTPADGVAPVMNLPAHLFSRMEYYMDNHKLSDLQDHIPQIDTMKNRLSKSKAWFNSVGARSCFWDPNFANRQKQICPDYQTKAIGVVQHGKLLSDRALVINGQPVNLKGQIYDLRANNDYKELLGKLPQREMGFGMGTVASQPSKEPWAFATVSANVGNATGQTVTEANWFTAEEAVKPRWVRGRSGNYTYYCVTTAINHLDVNALLLHADGRQIVERKAADVAYDGFQALGDQMVGQYVPTVERQKNIYYMIDNLALKKRQLWLHGSTDNVGKTHRHEGHHDSEMLNTVPLVTKVPVGVVPRGGAIEPPNYPNTRYKSYETYVTFGNNIINESIADGIPVILEQEYNDGRIHSEVVTWLPKLDIFVRRDYEPIQDDSNRKPRAGADANAHFTSWDAVGQSTISTTGAGTSLLEVQGAYTTYADENWRRYPRLSLFTNEVNANESHVAGHPASPQYVKNVTIRPIAPSEDLLPSTRHEIIWKPPLGIFDVSNTHTHTHTRPHTQVV